MSIVPFESRPITTMVVVCDLQGEINLQEAFFTLPIVLDASQDTKRKGKSITLNHYPIPGSIISMRYKDATRGVITKSSQKDAFRNSVTIYMSIADKNVNFRLGKSTIHICGVKSENQVRETFQHLRNLLLSTQDIIDEIISKPEDVIELRKHIATHITKTDEGLHLPYREGINKKMYDLVARNLKEHTNYNNFALELDWILGIKSVCSRDLDLKQISTSMINFNYSIGFEIKRLELSRRFRMLPGFFVTYNNMINHNVRIGIPYELEDNSNVRRKKKKDEIPHHLFMVYKSGCVTQTGPCISLMRDAYYQFFEAIMKMKHYIAVQELPKVKLRIVQPKVVNYTIVNGKLKQIPKGEEETDASSVSIDSISQT